MQIFHKFILLTISVLLLLTTSCDTLTQTQDEGLVASGIVEAIEVVISPEIAGRIIEVYVTEGTSVEPGDALFRMEDALLEAQLVQGTAAYETAKSNRDAAKAAVDSAQAAVQMAQTGVDAAEIQYQQVLNSARLEEQPTRAASWNQEVPPEFDLPVWYFNKSEKIAAAQAAVDAAKEALDTERANYDTILQDASNAELLEAEIALAAAQADFLVTQELADRQIDQNGKAEMDDYIQNLFDAAKSRLEGAQKAYDTLLTDKAFEDVLEAKARVVVSEERYQIALDQLAEFWSGEDSYAVQTAAVALEQAEAAFNQAQAGVNQANAALQQAEKSILQVQADLDLINIQINRLAIYAPVEGVIFTRNIEPGEVIQPGVAAITIGQLDRLTVTVYLPEDRYGQVQLEDHAKLTADSFPGQIFDAVVIRIADQAEFTPRNVQTQDDRRTTVFAVELSVEDPGGKLKPGMPTDVEFNQ